MCKHLPGPYSVLRKLLKNFFKFHKMPLSLPTKNKCIKHTSKLDELISRCEPFPSCDCWLRYFLQQGTALINADLPHKHI